MKSLHAAAAGVAGSHMAGHIVLSGRAKDTIVLSSGENVEPAPIEDALAVSPYIQHVVLLGQDARMLGALVSPSPEAFQELESVRGGLPCASCTHWDQLYLHAYYGMPPATRACSSVYTTAGICNLAGK